jgi:predicted small secreted protein
MIVDNQFENVPKNDVVIPIYISELALKYSIPGIMILAMISAIYGQYVMSVLNILVYITSILHWKRISMNGIMRYIDMTFVIMNFIYGTYIVETYLPNMKGLWYKNLTITCIAFSVNDTFFFAMNAATLNVVFGIFWPTLRLSN